MLSSYPRLSQSASGLIEIVRGTNLAPLTGWYLKILREIFPSSGALWTGYANFPSGWLPGTKNRLFTGLL
jgi:hypothetical protein